MHSRWKAALISSSIFIASFSQPAAAPESVGRNEAGSDSTSAPLIATDHVIRGVSWSGAVKLRPGDIASGTLLREGRVLTDDLIDMELARLDSLYFSVGLLSAQVGVDTTITGDGVEIRLELYEGERTTVGKISVSGQETMGSEEIEKRLGVAVGEFFDPVAVGEMMMDLLEYYTSSGYPFAQVWMTGFGFDRDSNSVELSFSVYDGDRSVIARIVPQGNSKTDSSLVVKTSRLHKGNTFREEELQRAVRYLSNSGLFENVLEPGVVAGEKGAVDLILPVEEKNRSNLFQGAFGFSRKDDGDYRVNGSVDLELGNIAGTGRDFSFRWLNDGEGYSMTELLYAEPFLFSSPLDLEVEMKQVVYDTLYDMVSAGLYLGLPVGTELSVTAGVAGDRNLPGGGEIERSSRQRYRLGLSGRAGNDVRFRIHLEGAYRKSFLSAGGSESENQLLYRLDCTLDRRTIGRQSFNARLFSEAVFSTGDVQVAEMYTLGGAKTLRGYRENQFRGERIGLLKLEYRFGGESRLFLFDDIGAWYRAEDGWQARNGFGFGVRSASKLGVVELSFGVGDDISLEGTKIHLSLIETF